MKHYFSVTVSTYVDFPFEEGLMDDGKINKNHLMYVAQAKLDENPDQLKSSRMIYHDMKVVEDGKETIL